MTEVQRDTYRGATSVYSDGFGLVPRNNRNHRKKQQLILEHTTANPGDDVLEVGCGSGLHAPVYADRFDYTGVDLSESLVTQAEERIDSGSVLQMDAMDLAFADDSFDAVVGTGILHHLSRPRQSLYEWQRVTKPGGSVTLMEPNYLFPKAFASTHLDEAERHKANMAPRRLRSILASVASEWWIEPQLYTPPWPASAHDTFDRLDAVCRHLPGIRWFGQMLLIQVHVPAE